MDTLRIPGDTTVEKGVDIMLATDMLKYAWDDLYDIGIVVSGDGDYTYAIKAIKEKTGVEINSICCDYFMKNSLSPHSQSFKKENLKIFEFLIEESCPKNNIKIFLYYFFIYLFCSLIF